MTAVASSFNFTCEKQPATGAKGVVVTNHTRATLAGSTMLMEGGNAIDAAVAALFALTVVEPMMVGIAGGGISHVRMASGETVIFDALSSAGEKAHAQCYTPVSDEPSRYMETVGKRNIIGPSSVAVPGNLAGWCAMHRRFGRLPFADVIRPAIDLAQNGFRVTHYLTGAIAEHAKDLLLDRTIAAAFLPGGDALVYGDTFIQPAYADSLKLIAQEGASALYGGALGRMLLDRLNTGGDDAGYITIRDLENYRSIERAPIISSYQDLQFVGPPPPASSGVHIAQMLNMLEAYDVRSMEFGSPDLIALLAEIIRVAFEDRRASSGDPAFVDVPVERLISKDYAEECRSRLFPLKYAPRQAPDVYESRDTTHITVSDPDGNIVTATHTINGIFGAKFMVPDAGFIPNNYMSNYDPRPGKALSVTAGKRVPTSMAPIMMLKGDKPVFALGLPGALRIFPSAFQSIVNIIDHGMDIQHAVEAPRIWTQGHELEIEPGHAAIESDLTARGYNVKVVPHIGGGMNGIAFNEDGTVTGAACWRADGTVLAQGGGLARPGVRFWPEKSRSVQQVEAEEKHG